MGVKLCLVAKNTDVWVFDNRIVFGTKRGEVTGEWRKLRIEKFHDLCLLPNVMIMNSRATKPVGHVGCKDGRWKTQNFFNFAQRCW
jgi:hypothetical protein